MAAEQETSGYDDDKSEGLQRRGNQLRAAAPLDAAPLQNEKSDDDEDGDQVDMAGERANEFAAVFADDDGYGGGGAAGGEPVAPAHDEAGVIAEGAARKIVLTAAARNSGAEFGHGRSTGKRVEAADDPDAEEKINVGEPLRNVAGRANDTSGDGIADRGGNSEPHAEDFEEAAASGGGDGVQSAARRGAARRGR